MLDALTDASAVQLIGYCGTLGGMVWPFCRGRIAMLSVQLVPTVCFSIHLAMLGAPTGAALNALATLQVLAAIPLGTHPNFRILYLMILPVIALLMAATWTGLPSLCAAAAMALMSLGRYRTEVVPFRLFMLLALPCWLAHNTLVGSLPAMLSDVVGIAVNLWMLARTVGRPARESDQDPAKETGSCPP
ncbi:YgjV family protein [Azospirillum doebereinerae]